MELQNILGVNIGNRYTEIQKCNTFHWEYIWLSVVLEGFYLDPVSKSTPQHGDFLSRK